MTNQPDRYEKFCLPEGTKKITFERDTKVANAGTFVIEREDHTLGNLARTQLHRDGAVTFSGYRIPHPLEYKMLVKVQTDGSKTPVAAMQQALHDLQEEARDVSQQWATECARVADAGRQDRPYV